MAGAASTRTAWPWCDDHDMTPQLPQPPEVRSGVANLAVVPLADLSSLPAATLTQAVRRVPPGRPVQTAARGTAFQSSI